MWPEGGGGLSRLSQSCVCLCSVEMVQSVFGVSCVFSRRLECLEETFLFLDVRVRVSASARRNHGKFSLALPALQMRHFA